MAREGAPQGSRAVTLVARTEAFWDAWRRAPEVGALSVLISSIVVISSFKQLGVEFVASSRPKLGQWALDSGDVWLPHIIQTEEIVPSWSLELLTVVNRGHSAIVVQSVNSSGSVFCSQKVKK